MSSNKLKSSAKKQSAHSPLKRFGAVLGLLFIFFCLIGLFANIIMGGDAKITLLFLFGLIVVPAVFYVFLMTVGIVKGRGEKDEDRA